MAKYRKKPIVVEAEQFWPNEKPWPDGVYKHPYREEGSTGYRINTLEGHHDVTPGDWIIIGVEGERYPCKPVIFLKTYEEV